MQCSVSWINSPFGKGGEGGFAWHGAPNPLCKGGEEARLLKIK
jgi:hypothetical protein